MASISSQQEKRPFDTLIERLENFRWRLLKSLFAIAVGTIMAFFLRTPLLALISYPLTQHISVLSQAEQPLFMMGLTEGITVMVELALAAGFILALPVLLYQTWAFITTGWRRRRKASAFSFVGLGVVLFGLGLLFGYFLLRYPVTFLITFADGGFTPLITARSYVHFVLLFLLTFGVMFQMPQVLTFLASIGLITEETLKRKRSIAHFLLWVSATILTPGGDLWSPVIMGFAMSGLYELSILLIRWRRQKTCINKM
jgi:sec-independent protein translocase protein TatC